MTAPTRWSVRCTRPGCGWTGERPGTAETVLGPCPQCSPLLSTSESTVITDHSIGGAA